MDGLIVELVDTAGERAVLDSSGSGDVERAGQGAAQAQRGLVDLVLWLERAEEPKAAVPEGVAILRTHADLCESPPAGAISALTDPEGARQAVSSLLRERLGWPESGWEKGQPVLFSKRLRAQVEAALKA